MDVWYFAYGSNVSIGQMKERVGEFKLSRRAIARYYRLTFNQYSKKIWHGYTANIQRTENFDDKAIGVAYHITDAQLAKLQTFEGTPPVEIEIELEDGNIIKHVKTFLWKTNEVNHEPPHAYKRRIEE